MKILVITQKVDLTDSTLGFFVEWLDSFSKNFEKVLTICLEIGSHNLSENVSVYSLGKEKGKSRLKYVVNFLYLIVSKRKSYDIVFIHMNQEYVILGFLIWKILGKKILFWRNHKEGSFITMISASLSDQVYYTSEQSFTSRYKHSRQMPVGISVPNINVKLAQPKTILSLGRISPIKKIHLLVESLKLLSNYSKDFKCDVVGDPANKEDNLYYERIRNDAETLVSSGLLKFFPGVKHSHVKDLFQSHRFFINITPDGSLDKTIFEAMANGSIVITQNSFFKDIIPSECYLNELEPEKIAQKIIKLFEISDDILLEWQLKNREYVVQNHSIDALVKIIVNGINE